MYDPYTTHCTDYIAEALPAPTRAAAFRPPALSHSQPVYRIASYTLSTNLPFFSVRFLAESAAASVPVESLLPSLFQCAARGSLYPQSEFRFGL